MNTSNRGDLAAGISGNTRITGLMGYPVSHSLSPRMHNAAFACAGINMCYVPFCVRPENLERAMDGIRALGLAGVNMTIPHKISAMDLVDHLSPEAQMAGAVNTVVNRKGCLTGYNTDVFGILAALNKDAGITPQGKKIIIAGAGGAARAAAYAMAMAGCREICVVNRALSRAEELCRLMKDVMCSGGGLEQHSPETGLHGPVSAHLSPWFNRSESRRVDTSRSTCTFTPGRLQDLGDLAQSSDFHIFINATSVGLAGESGSFSGIIESKHAPVVCDLVYTQNGTHLIRETAGKGFPTVSGLSILVWQGAKSFELWTGKEAPVEQMKRAVTGH